jgi:hypothetical protein
MFSQCPLLNGAGGVVLTCRRRIEELLDKGTGVRRRVKAGMQELLLEADKIVGLIGAQL